MKLSALILMVVATITLLGAGAAFGFWLVGVTSGPSGSALGDTLVKGATPSVSVSTPGGTPTANITFTSGTTQAGAAVSSYSVTRYNAYSGANAGSASGSCSISSGIVTCTDTPGAGSWQYTETPLYGANWTGPESSKSTATFISSATGLSPTSGAVGSSASISAQGYAASSALTVKIGAVTASITAGGTTNSTGTSTVTFTIPALPRGSQSVIVTDGSANTATSATNFTVNSALIVSPTSGTVGSTATLNGTGYTAGKSVATANVTFGSSGTVSITTQTVAADGTWSATFTVPNSSAGARTITAADSGTDSAITSYTVNSALSVAPTIGIVGSTATLSGTGYTAGNSVATANVTFGSSGSVAITSQTVAANGTWSATFTVPNSSAGAQTVTATDSGTDSAHASFTVTPQVTSLGSTSGTVGASVSVSGNGFAANVTSGILKVVFGGIQYSMSGTTNVSGVLTSAGFSVP